MQTTSEDAAAANSFNQRSKYSNGRSDLKNHPADYVTYDIGSYSRTELMQLKKRLTVELEQIQGLYEQIQSGSSLQHYRLSPDDEPQFPGKMKKQKRPIPYNSVKDPKRLCERSWNGFFDLNHIGDLMKKSRQILAALMKHKHSWVFREPVDALSLGLRDYHQIVKHPMDLGTVKAKFSKNAYATPTDFAEDVRLTFNNAILYNPKTDKVHAWAGELLARFEDLFRPIEEKMGCLPMEDHHHAPISSSVNDDLQRNSWNHIPTPEIERRKKSTPPSLIPPTISKKQQEKTQMPKNMMKPSASSSQSLVQSPPPPTVNGALLSKTNNPGKLPKPKAKDVGKREMSIEEKDRLSMGLQNLPQEKMPQLIYIIRKRNCSQLGQSEDELELDIETLDTETLWELDRFVTNCKKMVSKNKRQAVMANNVNMAGGTTTTTEDDNMVVLKEMGEKGGREDDDDDVDIGGEEMAMMSSFPAVEIEKDGGVGACREEEQGGGSSSGGSSSSGSDSSSSSSSSDSDSSGGNNSDADEAQSRGGKVK